MLQIKDIMMKSEELKASAKNNTEKDFEFAYFDNIDDALIEGLNQNQDFFSLLLGNDEIKKEVLGIFAEENLQGAESGRVEKTACSRCLRNGERFGLETGEENKKTSDKSKR